MPEVLHFPRLTTRAARAVQRQLFADVQLFEVPWQERRGLAHGAGEFAASGGRRISDGELTAIRERLLQLSGGAGAGPHAAVPPRAFDIALAIALFEEDLVPAPEALRDDVWAFLTTVLAPDIVRWRFGNTQERYLGGVRNAFQRLWLRAMAFRRDSGADVWEVVEKLSEDANVQILERPSVAASATVTRAIGEAWVGFSAASHAVPVERALRDVAVSLRIQNQVLCLEELPEDLLGQEIEAHFARAAGED